jgi:predicted ATPase
LREDRIAPGQHPFTIPVLVDGLNLQFTSPVTFLVGENGSGKSTILEALAWSAGFSAEGGNRSNSYSEDDDGGSLGRALGLTWRQKVSTGFFLRAETFFNFATYLEQSESTFQRYGGVSLHRQSHGEAFLSLFSHRFEDGLYLLDEPEAALSPQRQLAFLRILYELTSQRVAQFIIATHSPIILSFPGATVWSLDDGRIESVELSRYRALSGDARFSGGSGALFPTFVQRAGTRRIRFGRTLKSSDSYLLVTIWLQDRLKANHPNFSVYCQSYGQS